MFGGPKFVTCPDCGVTVHEAQMGEHVCDLGRRLDYKMHQLRGELAAFDAQYAAWLKSPSGKFAQWVAARTPGRLVDLYHVPRRQAERRPRLL